MGEERRTSRGSEFKLPFQWRLLTEGDSLATQISGRSILPAASTFELRRKRR
jgi:hypothetical protein